MNRRRLLALPLALALAAASVSAARAFVVGAQEVERVTVEELKTLTGRGGVVVLDVRGGVPDAKIKGALHIPLEQLEARISELPKGREILTYCA